MERYQATVFYGVPTLYEYLKDHKDTNKVDWKRLKLILSGADTLHESTMKGWAKRTGSNITEGYGLSETCATSHLQSAAPAASTGSFGCPIPNMQAAVIDPETLQFVPPGETGELVLAGPNVMLGYWNKPGGDRARLRRAATACAGCAPATSCAWTRKATSTSTTARKDLIKYKGYSIFAKDVEDVLYAHPQVKAAGVIGVPDPAVGQRIKAIVVLQPRSARQADRGGDQGLLQGAARRLQGAAHRRVPRRAAQDRRRQGLAPRAARRTRARLSRVSNRSSASRA